MPKLLAILLATRAIRLRDPRAELGRQVALTIAMVTALILAHITAMVIFEDLGLDNSATLLERIGVALWLTITTMTTVGYGDVAATTPMGRTATIITMYFGAVYASARLVALLIEYRFDRRNRRIRGTWRWQMRNHIVILNSPGIAADTYLQRLMVQIRNEPLYADLPAMLLTPDFPDGLPSKLQDLNLVHYSGSANNNDDLEAAGVRWAAHVIMLTPDETDARSDMMNFDVLHRLRDLHSGAQIIAEVVDDRNRPRFLNSGAMISLRPMRAYPEMLVRAMVAPGSESVIEDILTSDNNVIRRFDVRLNGQRWGDIARSLIEAGYGTAFAFIDTQARVIPNPCPDQAADGYGLILSSRANRLPSRTDIHRLLSALPPAAASGES